MSGHELGTGSGSLDEQSMMLTVTPVDDPRFTRATENAGNMIDLEPSEYTEAAEVDPNAPVVDITTLPASPGTPENFELADSTSVAPPAPESATLGPSGVLVPWRPTPPAAAGDRPDSQLAVRDAPGVPAVLETVEPSPPADPETPAPAPMSDHERMLRRGLQDEAGLRRALQKRLSEMRTIDAAKLQKAGYDTDDVPVRVLNNLVEFMTAHPDRREVPSPRDLSTLYREPSTGPEDHGQMVERLIEAEVGRRDADALHAEARAAVIRRLGPEAFAKLRYDTLSATELVRMLGSLGPAEGYRIGTLRPLNLGGLRQGSREHTAAGREYLRHIVRFYEQILAESALGDATLASAGVARP